MITSEAYVSISKKIEQDVYLLSVQLSRYKPWFSGMFMQLSLNPTSASSYWLDSRAFSFASYGTEDAKILVKREGNFTRRLTEMAEDGFTASVKYPFGDVLLNSNSNKIMIAGGTGVSIFLSYIDFLNSVHSRSENYLFHSIKRGSADIRGFYWNHIPDNVNYLRYVTSNNDSGYTGRLTLDDILTQVDNPKDFEFYVCGPPNFNEFWIRKLTDNGFNFKVEQWLNREVVK